jgi:hypothetical protein
MRNRGYQAWLEFALMVIVSGAIYLPFITQFGYYNDDWYSMYAARVGGSQVFHEIYSLDRPGRAYVMIPLYELFHDNPLYYNISAYVFRILGAVSLLWLLRLIWPAQKRETFLIAFLFLIYPGFLSMPNGIDFQSHLIAILLVFISIGMSILAIRAKVLNKRIVFWAGALLTGWAYLSQMEYYIGFEAARLCLLALLASREDSNWKKTIARAIYSWLPYAPVSIFYLIWRIFFFTSERTATDVSLQLGMLATAPLVTLYSWIGNFIQSFLNVTLLAWGVPLYLLSFQLDTSNSIRGITLAVIVCLVSLMAIRYLGRSDPDNDSSTSVIWRQEMLVVGILWAISGLIVVVLANRLVTFPLYSRYGMVSATGAIMALVAGLALISERRLQIALIAFLFFSAAFTQYANGAQSAKYAQNMRAFWWQVSWRVPQFVQGATIIANYPNSGNREESFTWGPANHIYYPYKIKPDSIQAGVYAILLDHDAVVKILTRERQVFRKRIIVSTFRNYRNFVILTQPTPNSCVQIIDGASPEYSHFEIDPILVAGPYSEVEHIALDEPFKTPPQFLFGSEPAHGWCYYYEKAAFARQKGDWDEVLDIGKQAFEKELAPADLIEWMPFLQAYARAGDIDRLTELAPTISADPYIALQACRIIGSMPGLAMDVLETVDSLYCPE